MPSFLSGLADKAQHAINSSPLANHLPGQQRPTSPDSAAQPSANNAATGETGSSTTGGRSHAFESIQHQLRTLGQQYASTTPAQKIITTAKGVALDYDSVSRDSKAYSKELYTWGQTEPEDIKDVSDRLAYLNFVQGSLASSLAVNLDKARAPFKTLRDAETALTPRRNIRSGLESQIARLEHDQQKTGDKKVAELREQLRKAESEDSPQEKEIELLKRKALRDSERLKWEAVREYGEKLVLLSQAAEPIVGALPAVPPTSGSPYNGTQATAAARASLQRALDNYKTGHINLPTQQAGADLSRSDTRSFGESHKSELSQITSNPQGSSAQPGLPVTPPATAYPQLPPAQQQHLASHSQTGSASSLPPSSFTQKSSTSPPPINPAALNQSPAPIPEHHSGSVTSPSIADEASTTHPIPAPVPIPVHNTSSSPNPASSGDVPTSTSATKVPAVHPTVAETGVPVSGGPGPASGSLRDLKAASPTAGPKSGGLPGNEPSQSFGQVSDSTAAATGAIGEKKYETAEEEKARLAREDRERVLATGGSVPPTSAAAPTGVSTGQGKYETAEEEKKRLEREEREKLLHGESNPAGGDKEKKDGDELPPYADY